MRTPPPQYVAPAIFCAFCSAICSMPVRAGDLAAANADASTPHRYFRPAPAAAAPGAGDPTASARVAKDPGRAAATPHTPSAARAGLGALMGLALLVALGVAGSFVLRTGSATSS